MRVALLSRGAFPLHEVGGMERAVYLLARHLQARGVETVLFTRPATRPVEAGAFPGEVVTVPYGTGPFRHGSVLDRTLRYPAFAARLGAAVAEAVRAGRVDLVDAQGLTAWGYARERTRGAGLRPPLVMNPQGMEEHKARGLKRLALTRLRRLSREAAREADRVVATDEATRAEVPALLGVDPARVVVLPNGIDPEAIAAATPRQAPEAAEAALPSLAGASPVLLSVGRLEAYKGFDATLGALRRLAAAGRLPERWLWVVVGEGPGRQALEGGLGDLTRHVVLAGHVGESTLHALYARADLFVHATRYEGSSLVTLEAMAHALPVVATRAGGIPDKVVDGETGRLVEVGDEVGLAEALAEALADPARRRAWGERGRERALALFAWPALAGRVVALYEELLAEAASDGRLP